MPQMIRVGLCQYESVAGDLAGNLAKVERGLAWADRERVAVVAFPECFLTGYPDTAQRARADAFAVDSPQAMKLLDLSSRFEATVIVGFNETRGAELHNTAVVIHKGHLLGRYSKCTAYQAFHTQGREFPVFERDGVTFGVIICSDGGFIEPARILAAKGAKIVFAPHFNYIGAKGLIDHFQKVRSDHIARAVENHIHFIRANNVVLGAKDPAIERYEGVGYGDSYIVDPGGELVVRSRRGVECELFADLDVSGEDRAWGVGRSLFSHREFGKYLEEAARQKK
jgi:predicted amidohydrolase